MWHFCTCSDYSDTHSTTVKVEAAAQLQPLSLVYMSLNSVVNNLVRAAAGIPADISDGDLDRHVAELLAREAKERDAKWSEIGLGGLLGNDKAQ